MTRTAAMLETVSTAAVWTVAAVDALSKTTLDRQHIVVKSCFPTIALAIWVLVGFKREYKNVFFAPSLEML